MNSSKLASSQIAFQKLCNAVNTAGLAQEKARREYLSASSELDKWMRRYDLALKAGRSDLVEAAKFQVDRYETITSKLKSLIIEQDIQSQKLKEQKDHWEQAINHPITFDDLIDITTETSIESIDVSFDEGVFDLTQPEDGVELQKNILTQKRVITELELKILPRQIEYNQILRSAKIWKNRTKEVREWGIKEITQKVDEQFQAFRQKAISLKAYITQQEKIISEAYSLLHQYELRLTNTTSVLDKELAILKAQILGGAFQNQAQLQGKASTETTSRLSVEDVEFVNEDLKKKLDQL